MSRPLATKFPAALSIDAIGELEQVVAYVRQIDELDLDDVEPMSHAVDVKNVFREDEVRPSLDHETVMANAPAEVNDQFKVPKIME